jgi:hypothetical protein
MFDKCFWSEYDCVFSHKFLIELKMYWFWFWFFLQMYLFYTFYGNRWFMLILVTKVVCVFFSRWLIVVFFVNLSIVVDCKNVEFIHLGLYCWDFEYFACP